MNDFSAKIIKIIQLIPYGTVSTYGTVATLAGSPSGARQVARILHTSSKKYDLPWHRVVNRKGELPPRSSMSHLDQRTLLENEGVEFGTSGAIDLGACPRIGLLVKVETFPKNMHSHMFDIASIVFGK